MEDHWRTDDTHSPDGKRYLYPSRGGNSRRVPVVVYVLFNALTIGRGWRTPDDLR